MIANCTCGTVHWAAPPLSSCPRCGETTLVGARLETLEEFEERILAQARASAHKRSLPEPR